jgi:hypothetical protein
MTQTRNVRPQTTDDLFAGGDGERVEGGGEAFMAAGEMGTRSISSSSAARGGAASILEHWKRRSAGRPAIETPPLPCPVPLRSAG